MPALGRQLHALNAGRERRRVVVNMAAEALRIR